MIYIVSGRSLLSLALSGILRALDDGAIDGSVLGATFRLCIQLLQPCRKITARTFMCRLQIGSGRSLLSLALSGILRDLGDDGVLDDRVLGTTGREIGKRARGIGFYGHNILLTERAAFTLVFAVVKRFVNLMPSAT